MYSSVYFVRILARTWAARQTFPEHFNKIRCWRRTGREASHHLCNPTAGDSGTKGTLYKLVPASLPQRIRILFNFLQDLAQRFANVAKRCACASSLTIFLSTDLTSGRAEDRILEVRWQGSRQRPAAAALTTEPRTSCVVAAGSAVGQELPDSFSGQPNGTMKRQVGAPPQSVAWTTTATESKAAAVRRNPGRQVRGERVGSSHSGRQQWHRLGERAIGSKASGFGSSWDS
jgi:hypothetical protein